MKRIVSLVIILLVIAALVLGIIFSKKGSDKKTTGTYHKSVPAAELICER